MNPPLLFPLTQVRVAEFSVLNKNLDDAYIASEAVDVDKPVILAEIAPEQHIAFLTTSVGYTAYIDYWNPKVKDIRRLLR